jgi:hypothetical protein
MAVVVGVDEEVVVMDSAAVAVEEAGRVGSSVVAVAEAEIVGVVASAATGDRVTGSEPSRCLTPFCVFRSCFDVLGNFTATLKTRTLHRLIYFFPAWRMDHVVT